MKYPESPRKPVIDAYHGIPVEDPYRWLEDSTDPDVQITFGEGSHATP